MKSILAIASLLVLTQAQAAAKRSISQWKETPGISEEQAYLQTWNAIATHLADQQDGETCTVDEVWSLEREKDLRADFPQKRGPIFAITAYATGPDRDCSQTRTYDCRVVFNQPPSTGRWQVEYTDCEPVNSEYED